LAGDPTNRLAWEEPLHSLQVGLQRDYGLSAISSRALVAVRELTVHWANAREPNEGFVDFEAKQIEALRELGRASTELALALAEAKLRHDHPERFEAGGTAYRLTSPEPRSLLTWFGTVRHRRSYARPLEGGAGWFLLAGLHGLPERDPHRR